MGDISCDPTLSIVKTHPIGATLSLGKGDDLCDVNHLGSRGKGHINGDSASSGERTRNNCPALCLGACVFNSSKVSEWLAVEGESPVEN